MEALNASAPVPGGAAPALYGRLARARAERARREERERAPPAERARIDERRRPARETRGVVSHRVSLIVLQAGALASASADPGVREIADRIRAAGGRPGDGRGRGSGRDRLPVPVPVVGVVIVVGEVRDVEQAQRGLDALFAQDQPR